MSEGSEKYNRRKFFTETMLPYGIGAAGIGGITAGAMQAIQNYEREWQVRDTLLGVLKGDLAVNTSPKVEKECAAMLQQDPIAKKRWGLLKDAIQRIDEKAAEIPGPNPNPQPRAR